MAVLPAPKLEGILTANGIVRNLDKVSMTSDLALFYRLVYNIGGHIRRIAIELSAAFALAVQTVKLRPGNIIVAGATHIFQFSARNILDRRFDPYLFTAQILGLFDLIRELKFGFAVINAAGWEQGYEHYYCENK